MAKIVILGGGESGTGAALLAKAKGFDVFLSDNGTLNEKYKTILTKNTIDFEENQHTESKILMADEVIKSPGIPEKVPIIQKIQQQKIPIISEIEFAARYTKSFLIGVTGSNGKTTTTNLTYHILKKLGLSVGKAGNVGDSFARQVLEDPKEVYVLELSSFQLDTMVESRIQTAILLNITPDHLDRYEKKIEKYEASKFRILQNQTKEDVFIYFSESPSIQKNLINFPHLSKDFLISFHKKEGVWGAVIKKDSFAIYHPLGEYHFHENDLATKGLHNLINTAAAILAVLSIKNFREDELKNALKDFKNDPHRLEIVRTLDGVRYINDSKATNVDSVFYALKSFDEPILLILGGQDKGDSNDYEQIRELVEKKVKGLICLGADNSKLEAFFKDKVSLFFSTNNIENAVGKAQKWSKKGDVVLLSPACASFDLFENYKDRGDKFRVAVNSLPLRPI